MCLLLLNILKLCNFSELNKHLPLIINLMLHTRTVTSQYSHGPRIEMMELQSI
jgi:hypothetical protein